MSQTRETSVPEQIDPSGPDSITYLTRCTGRDEYDSVRESVDGTDAFEERSPHSEYPLYARDDVRLTPCGGAIDEALARQGRQAAANVRTPYEGKAPESTVNPRAPDEVAE